MQRSGEIPGMSSSEYPIAFLYFLSSQRSKASSTLFRSAFTITGYVELGPRKNKDKVQFFPHNPNPNGPDGMINSEDEEKIKLFQERYGRDKEFPDISEQLSESSKAWN
ncbi:unnamed protein product [Microthlaspi erraticum]|uniref:Uncharacterized protein n=1 Tax=Microthlaspi erraticum TaxID=1685480 RepID=A0A6D2JYG9_9BRAS|nr:unnamed protein product [Microthlaspi erraticum]